MRLVIEVADTSLAYDLGTKPPIYAAQGVCEYWVINAHTLETTTHRDPVGDGYRTTATFGAGTRLAPQLAPELALRLEDFDLG